jgi:single-strand DNA-binding protein
MRSVNKVILLGNLTRDPELKHTEGKKPVCIFGLATNRSWPIKPGEKRIETEFHRIVAFDKLAETCNQYLKKGERFTLRGGSSLIPILGKMGLKGQALRLFWKSWSC